MHWHIEGTVRVVGLSTLAILLLLLLPLFISAGSYPSSCDPVAQAVLDAVGGCSAIDPVKHDKIALRCCPTGGQTTAAAPVVNISATPSTVGYNGKTALTWAATNAASCTASGDWSGSKATSFHEEVGPLTSSKTYKIVCAGTGGTSEEARVTVTVGSAPVIDSTTAAAGCDAIAEAVISAAGGCSSVDTVKYPNLLRCCPQGGTGTSTGGGSGAGGGIGGTSGGGGSTGGTGGSSGGGGTGGSGGGAGGGGTGGGGSSGGGGGFGVGFLPGGRITTASFGTGAKGLSPTMVFVVDRSDIKKGESVTLSWSSTNAESCTANGGWSGSKGTSGSATVGPISATKEFGLVCKSSSGEARRVITIIVPSVYVPPVQPAYQQMPTFIGPLEEIPPAAGSKSQGSAKTVKPPAKKLAVAGPRAEITPTVSPPIISFSADTALAAGDSTTLLWAVSNADSCTALGNWIGTRGLSGSESTGSIKDDATYVLICKGKGGEASKTIKIAVSGKKGLIATIFDGIVGLFTGREETPASPNSSSGTPTVQREELVTPEEIVPGGRAVSENFNGPPEVSLEVTPIIRSGRTANIEWDVNNASKCIAGGAWSGGKDRTGKEITAELNTDTTYILTCVGRNGETAVASSTVVVYAESVLNNTFDAVKNVFGEIFSR